MVPKRVLVLHGYTQNASIFSKRLGALRKHCAKDVDFVFVDGPIVLSPADLVPPTQGNPEQEGQQIPAQDQDPSLTPRAWWKANEDRTRAVGLEQSLAVLKAVLQSSATRFDGILGFSQGAALATVLSALLEHPTVYPPFLVDGASPHPPFDFCIAVSGFRTRDPIADRVFSHPFMTRTLHVLGQTDVIVTMERAKEILEISGNKRVEMHDGGHFVPSKSDWRVFFADFMKDPAGEVSSPKERAPYRAVIIDGSGSRL